MLLSKSDLYFFSFCLIFGYLLLKMAMANNAEFLAPAFPIARVATGTPAGICTVDNRLSIPSVTLGMGTPSTGIVVKAAVTPAKCAAPPAAAIITS